jgi:hypothetical protein
MAGESDMEWWAEYRGRLEERFKQGKAVVRAQEIRLL